MVCSRLVRGVCLGFWRWAYDRDRPRHASGPQGYFRLLWYGNTTHCCRTKCSDSRAVAAHASTATRFAPKLRDSMGVCRRLSMPVLHRPSCPRNPLGCAATACTENRKREITAVLPRIPGRPTPQPSRRTTAHVTRVCRPWPVGPGPGRAWVRQDGWSPVIRALGN